MNFVPGWHGVAGMMRQAAAPAIGWDPAQKNAALILSNSNLTVSDKRVTPTTVASVRGITGKSAGKFYFEILALKYAYSNTSNNFRPGIVGKSIDVINSSTLPGASNVFGGHITLWPPSTIYTFYNGTNDVCSGQVLYEGERVGFAVDLDLRKFWACRLAVGNSSPIWYYGSGGGNPDAGGAGWALGNDAPFYPFLGLTGNTGEGAGTITTVPPFAINSPPFLGWDEIVPEGWYTTPGITNVPVPGGKTTVTVECIGAGGGAGGGGGTGPGSGGGGAAYAKRNNYSLSGMTNLWLSIPPRGPFNAAGADTIVRANNSTGAIICLAKGGFVGVQDANQSANRGKGGLATSCTGDVRYNGGNAPVYTGVERGGGGGAAGPNGAGGNAPASSDFGGVSGGAPAGAGGDHNKDGFNYGGGGGNASYSDKEKGGQGWIKLTWA